MRAGVELRFLGKRRGPSAGTMRGLSQVLGVIRPDIIHTHMGALRYVMLAPRLPRAPVLHTLHSDPSIPRSKAIGAVDRLCAARGAKSVVLSHRLADHYRQSYGQWPFAIVQIGLNPPHDLAAASERTEHTIQVLAVGRLASEKGFADLLHAFIGAQMVDNRLRLTIVGDGPLKHQLAETCARADVESKVTLAGYVEDPWNLMLGADVFVLSSLFEGMPLAVLEAMLASTPVIATAVGGIPDLITHKSNGYLVRPGDVADLQSALLLLASSRDLRREIASEALDTVHTYTEDAMVDGYLALSTLVSSRNDGSGPRRRFLALPAARIRARTTLHSTRCSAPRQHRRR